MNLFGALICIVRGHKWQLKGPEFGYVKHVCNRCKRTKHTKILSSWWEMKRRAEGGFIENGEQ